MGETFNTKDKLYERAKNIDIKGYASRVCELGSQMRIDVERVKNSIHKKMKVVPVSKYNGGMKNYENEIYGLMEQLSKVTSNYNSEVEFNEKMQVAFELAVGELADKSTPKAKMSIGYWVARAEMKQLEKNRELLKFEPNFSSIKKMNDRNIQHLLRYEDITNRDLAVALTKADEKTAEAIFNNISKRLAAMVREDMHYMDAPSQHDIDNARIKMSKAVRRIYEKNKNIFKNEAE